ncbi:hypothetical protein Tco_0852383, partial [Tanacetum coccineum]
SSIRFTFNKKKVSLDVDIFRDVLQFCPKIPGQVFEDLPLEQYILSFIRDLGHTRDITYLTNVNIDYLHQPWRAFSTVINKCLSGKETGMDKIHLLFQIEYKDAKKTNKMSYPRFTKIIIDYFMSKDQSISRINKMFWHTARDDTMFTSMRCISRHEDTHVYGTILPKELTNQAMLESNAYKTYYAFDSGEKAPKPKLKSKAKVAKFVKKKQPAKKPKAKGLTVLSEVALTEAEQLKLATKRSKTQFHSSHACGSGDGVDTQLKVPDELQQKSSRTNEGTGTKPGVLDVPIYKSESKKESWGDSEDEDEDDKNDSDDLSDEGENDNDGDDDDDVNDDDKQEGDDKNNDDKETDSDRTKCECESVEVAVLTRSSSQPTSTYEAATSHSEFERTKILIDKMEKNKSYDKADYKNKLYDALVESYNTDKDLFDSYGEVFSLKMSRDDKEPSHTIEDSGMQQDQEFVTGDNDEQPADKEVTKAYWFKKPESRISKEGDLSRRYSTSVTKTKAATYELKWIKDLVPKFNLTSSKDVYSRRRIISVTRLTIMKKYDYSHLEEIEVRRDDQKIYMFKEDQFKRKRLMRADELHKFSDGILNDVRTALHDIATGIRMEYLPMRK